MKVPNKFTEMFPEYPVNDQGMPVIEGITIREWGSRVFTDYVEYLVGKEGWKERGCSDPSHLIDAVFAQIQVTLFGAGPTSADAKEKHELLDKILVVVDR